MNVVWEINAVSLIAIVAHFVGVAVFIVRASDRAINADRKADKALQWVEETRDRLAQLSNAERASDQAAACARECKEKVTILAGAFAAYRESVAQNYVSWAAMRDLESRMEKNFDKMAIDIKDAIRERGPVRDH
ncbi:MAG TPA: hypothetical protein VEX16_05580 [Methyloceanibacter sp.]|nr:hypothetical protein [Methyloceanibacter sp.]